MQIPVTPERQPSDLAYTLSTALAIVGAFGSAVAVAFPGVLHGPVVMAGSARGTDVVILLVAIPTLVISMILSKHGSIRARIAWLGSLSYLLYNSVVFAFDVPFNALFLVYVGMLSLSFWSVAALLTGLSAEKMAPHFALGRWMRVVAAYLFMAAAFFLFLWMSDILPAIVQNTAPTSYAGTGFVTNPFHVEDLGFSIPVTFLSTIWLWWRRPWGLVLSGVLLVYFAIETASISMDQLFGSLADPSSSVASMAAVPVFAFLTLIGLVFTAVYFRALKP
jgi:hypothetical protein